MAEDAISRTVENLILRRLATVKQTVLAGALDCSETRISRFTSGEVPIKISELDALFEALGLVVTEVGGDFLTLPAEEVHALKVMARKGLRFMGDGNGN